MAFKRKINTNLTDDELLSDFTTDPRNISHKQDVFLSTGNLVWNKLLGGGWPCGSLVELFAPEGAGKTSVLIDTVILLQRFGFGSAIFDTEGGWNEQNMVARGAILGMEHPEAPILMGRYPSTEVVDEKFARIVKHPKIKFIVLDSYQGLVPQKILDFGVADVEPGLQARYNSVFLLKCTKQLQMYQKCMVVVNQMRTKIDFSAGASVESGGGHAVKHFASVRFFMDRKEQEFVSTSGEDLLYSDDKFPTGHWVEGTSFKNRINAPFRKGRAFLRYGAGFDNTYTLLDLGKSAKMIVQSSSYFKIKMGDTEQTIQGLQNTIDFLRDKSSLFIEALRGQGMEI